MRTRPTRRRSTRALRAALLAALALTATAVPAAAADAPPTPTQDMGASLPTIADFPAARLSPRATEVHASDSERAPYPCAAYAARGMPGSRHWGEWNATGLGRRVMVLAFSYGDERIDAVWRQLRDGIAACPPTSRVRADDGTRAVATQVVLSTERDRIRMEIVTRSGTGRDREADRAIVYQRVGDAIQKVQVSRTALTPRDRRLVRAIARVAADRYRATRERLVAAGEPVPGADAAVIAASSQAALAQTLAAIEPGATINVSIGDSMVSGEAGRWRGNVLSGRNVAQIDAYGESAYWDTATGESIPGCHRSKGSAIHVPGTVGVNLACSGAKTTSGFVLLEYKPGIDDGYTVPALGVRLPGQLTMLDQVARRGRVKTLLLTIGGNDMGFGPIMAGCMAAFATPWPFAYRCSESAVISGRMTDAALAEIGRKVQGAIERAHATMLAAGYATGSYELIVQGYPRLIDVPNRYPETYAGRMFEGGCPLYDDDVRYLNDRFAGLMREFAGAAERASATTGQPVRWVDITELFAGRELCARDAARVDTIPADQIVARAERVHMVRILPPFGLSEPFHPNQIGQQAVQACLREAMANPTVRRARCAAPADWSQVDATGLPPVRFSALP